MSFVKLAHRSMGNFVLAKKKNVSFFQQSLTAYTREGRGFRSPSFFRDRMITDPITGRLVQVEGMMTYPVKEFEYSCITLVRLSPPEYRKNNYIYIVNTEKY